MQKAATVGEAPGSSVRVGIISVYAQSIPSFRGDLIREMIRRGCTVYVLASDYTDETSAAVRELGAVPVSYSMARAGMNPLRDLRDTLSLAIKLRSLRLDLLFSYFIKPVIYGTLAGWMAGVPLRFAMIEGAGYIFTETGKQSARRTILRRAVSWLYKMGLARAMRVFMLNPDDADLFSGEGMVDRGKVVILNGIGLDLDHYRHVAPPARVGDELRFLFVGRLLREKGVYDYVAAAREVKLSYPGVRFSILGSVDENPGAISEDEVRQWVDEGLVEWPGQVADVRDWFGDSDVFVLPSYREGLPRSTQEAMATGRPVITTDVPGCRQTVDRERNGFLVPVREPAALAGAMLKFIKNPLMVEEMGLASRRMAEERFDVRVVNSVILNEMGIK